MAHSLNTYKFETRHSLICAICQCLKYTLVDIPFRCRRCWVFTALMVRVLNNLGVMAKCFTPMSKANSDVGRVMTRTQSHCRECSEICKDPQPSFVAGNVGCKSPICRSGQRGSGQIFGTEGRLGCVMLPHSDGHCVPSFGPYIHVAAECHSLHATQTRQHEESGGDGHIIALTATATLLTAQGGRMNATPLLPARRRVGRRRAIMAGGARGRAIRSTASRRALRSRLRISPS
jgi:hypothetical protein